MKSERGFTLVETLLAAVMVSMVLAVLAYMFQATIAGWSTQGTRTGLGVSVGKAAKEIARDLRKAREAVSNSSGEVRFTENGTDHYIYYLYNATDSYPSKFKAALYELRKAALSGGIDGTFTYGSGDLIARDILPPPSSTLSVDGTMVKIDLGGQRGPNTIRSVMKVKPRNI